MPDVIRERLDKNKSQPRCVSEAKLVCVGLSLKRRVRIVLALRT